MTVSIGIETCLIVESDRTFKFLGLLLLFYLLPNSFFFTVFTFANSFHGDSTRPLFWNQHPRFGCPCFGLLGWTCLRKPQAQVPSGEGKISQESCSKGSSLRYVNVITEA